MRAPRLRWRQRTLWWQMPRSRRHTLPPLPCQSLRRGHRESSLWRLAMKQNDPPSLCSAALMRDLMMGRPSASGGHCSRRSEPRLRLGLRNQVRPPAAAKTVSLHDGDSKKCRRKSSGARRDLTVPLKRAHGQLLAAWRGKHGVALTARLPWGTMRRFWEEQGVPAALDDRRLLSYARAYERHGYRQHAPGTAHCVCPPLHRRCPGKQGRPNLREALFEWFCSVKAAVAAFIPPAGLGAQARLLREQHMLAALRQNGPVSIPKVTPCFCAGRRVPGLSASSESTMEGQSRGPAGAAAHHVVQRGTCTTTMSVVPRIRPSQRLRSKTLPYE